MRTLSIFVLCLLATTLACAQATLHTNLDQNASAWTICVKPACNPGGDGIPTKESITSTGTNWPANSLKISETGPAYSNFLAYQNAGATSATNFYADFYVMPNSNSSTGNYQALEYDVFAYNAPYRFMFGSQCKLGAKWQVWDDLHGSWLDTPLACSLSFGQWHHVQWWFHRVTGDTSCSGYPCEHYDTIGIDNVYSTIAMTEPAGPLQSGWSNQSGINFQLDIAGVSNNVTILEFIKDVNLVEQ